MTITTAAPKTTHLLLDLDGTLLGSHDLRLRLSVLSRAMVEWRSCRRTLRAFRSMRRALEGEDASVTNDRRAEKAYAAVFGLSESEARARLDASLGRIFPKLERCFFPMPGASGFMDWAAERYKLILATNPVWSEEIVGMRVRWAGLSPGAFQSMTHARRMHSCKPRVSYYEELLRQEGLSPERCLMVGNDLRKDLPAARAGIPVFILGPSPVAQPLQSGGAPSWTGDYGALRSLLGGP